MLVIENSFSLLIKILKKYPNLKLLKVNNIHLNFNYGTH